MKPRKATKDELAILEDYVAEKFKSKDVDPDQIIEGAAIAVFDQTDSSETLSP